MQGAHPEILEEFMGGYDMRKHLQHDMIDDIVGSHAEDMMRMKEVVDRFRMQTRYIVLAIRRWKERHQDIPPSLPKRYSAYEGLLCKQDLQQHWALYKRAMREYSRMVNSMDA